MDWPYKKHYTPKEKKVIGHYREIFEPLGLMFIWGAKNTFYEYGEGTDVFVILWWVKKKGNLRDIYQIMEEIGCYFPILQSIYQLVVLL